MFSLFSKDRSFGVDIGTQSIKIVQLQKKDDASYKVMNYAIWSSGTGEVIQEQRDNTMAASHIARIIGEMLDEADIHMNDVYFALPSFFTFSSVISVPEMSDEELDEAIPLQARQHIPVPMEEVQVNWVNLGMNKTDNTLNILIIAIPNSVISKYQSIAKQLNVDIQGFELDIFSRLRALNLPQQHTCIIDIGSRSTSVSVVDDHKELRMIRSFDMGGNQLTRRLADTMEVSMERAEHMKISNGLTGDRGVTNVLTKQLERFFKKDIGGMLKEYSEMQGIKVQHIAVTGGIAQMKGINDFAKRHLNKFVEDGVVVKEAHPSDKILLPDEMKEEVFYEEVWQDISLAIGMALRKYM